jgi:hypothetical protein
MPGKAAFTSAKTSAMMAADTSPRASSSVGPAGGAGSCSVVPAGGAGSCSVVPAGGAGSSGVRARSRTSPAGSGVPASAASLAALSAALWLAARAFCSFSSAARSAFSERFASAAAETAARSALACRCALDRRSGSLRGRSLGFSRRGHLHAPHRVAWRRSDVATAKALVVHPSALRSPIVHHSLASTRGRDA